MILINHDADKAHAQFDGFHIFNLKIYDDRFNEHHMTYEGKIETYDP